jgi:hypothetical protein
VFGKTSQGDAVGQCLAGTSDPAETLLARGLAAVYRSGNDNDSAQQALAEKYDTAETLARKQGVGLWQPPAPAADPAVAEHERLKYRILGFAGFALLILAIFTVSITRLSIARRDRIERASRRQEQRTTLSFAMAAEIEIVLALTRQMIERFSDLPADRPVPGAVSAVLALPSTPFWSANAERLHLLPVEVTVPLLRFHACYEDAARKLALANAVPSGTLTTTLKALVEIGATAVTAVEASLGITRPAESAPKPSMPPLAPQSPPSSELKTPPSAVTN